MFVCASRAGEGVGEITKHRGYIIDEVKSRPECQLPVWTARSMATRGNGAFP
jgi:hypothetical protein